MPVELRYYQKDTLKHTREQFEKGVYSMVHCWPTGTGKSVGQNTHTKEFAPIEKYRSLFIAGLNRDLAEQAIDGFKEQYPECQTDVEVNGKLWPGIGLVMGDINQPHARIVIASAQTVFPQDIEDLDLPENKPIRPGDAILNAMGGIELNPASERRWLISPRFDEILKYGWIALWQHDECFAAGTLIDGCPIEKLKVGDFVTAFNESTQQFEKKKIVRLFSHTPKGDVVKVKVGETSIVCTSNHPIYTKRGWVAAGELNVGDKILRSDLRQLQENIPNKYERTQGQNKLYENGLSCVLLPSMYNNGEKNVSTSGYSTTELLPSELFSLQHRSGPVQSNGSPQNNYVERIWQNILFDEMYEGDSQQRIVYPYVENKSKICFRTNEEKQSNEQTGDTRQNASNIATYPVETEDTWREWDRVHTTPTDLSNSVGGWLAYGVCGGHTETETRGLSNCLQNRYCAPEVYDCHRSGWGESSREESQGSRSEENRFSEWVGVDSVTVLEQSSDGTYGGMLPEGLVYNFEVEGLHTYVANGIVVHNCHHAPADGSMAVIGRLPKKFKPEPHENKYIRKVYRQLDLIYLYLGLPPIKIIGWTATPIRNDGVAMSNVFEVMGYHLTDAAATEQGYILPVAKAVRVDIRSEDTGEVKHKLKTVENWEERVIQAWRDHAHDRACTCFFVGRINGLGDVEASKKLREAFHEAGVPAVHIDGTGFIDVDGKFKPNKLRKQLYARIKRGEIPVICNFNVIMEGKDLPIIDCIGLLRSVNEINFTQMMGRARRRYGDQKDALLIDFTGQPLVMLLHGEMTGIPKDLFEPPPPKKETDQIMTGRSMKDVVAEGTVEGHDNVYSYQDIQRKSKMMWYTARNGNMSMAVTRKEFGNIAYLITSPNYTEAAMYEDVMGWDHAPEKLRNLAATLYIITSTFTLWKTGKAQTGKTAPNGYWLSDYYVIGGNPATDANGTIQSGELDDIEYRASMQADKEPNFDKHLASKKGKSWRKGSMTDAQKPLFEALFGVTEEVLSAGEAGQRITHEFAERAVYNLLNNAKRAFHMQVEGLKQNV